MTMTMRMLKRLVLLLALLLAPAISWAANTITITGSGAPAGSCSFVMYYVDSATGGLYDCPAGSWVLVSAGGGSTAFNGLTSGTNTTAAMVVGAGASLAVPTQVSTDNSTLTASTAYVTTGIANAVAGVNPAVAVKAATAAVLPNSPTYNNGVAGIGAFLTTATTNTALVVDGITIGLNDRVLVKNQASSFQNGVYYESQLQGVGLAWILTRALDFDAPSDMNNTGAIPVISGTANTTTQWVISSAVTTVGTDAVTFAQFSSNPANLVTSTSPGAGIAHFAGATQNVPSSLIVAADITSATITPTQLSVAATPALVQLCSLVASASASLDFKSANCANGVFSSSYHDYVIKISPGLIPNTNDAAINILVSTDGGSTYQTTSYLSVLWAVALDSTTTVAVNSTTGMMLTNDFNTGTTRASLTGQAEIFNPADATNNKQFRVSTVGPGTTHQYTYNGGGIWNSATAITAFQIKPSSGTLTSGTVTLYGVSP